jgi:hypothetical protein
MYLVAINFHKTIADIHHSAVLGGAGQERRHSVKLGRLHTHGAMQISRAVRRALHQRRATRQGARRGHAWSPCKTTPIPAIAGAASRTLLFFGVCCEPTPRLESPPSPGCSILALAGSLTAQQSNMACPSGNCTRRNSGGVLLKRIPGHPGHRYDTACAVIPVLVTGTRYRAALCVCAHTSELHRPHQPHRPGPAEPGAAARTRTAGMNRGAWSGFSCCSSRDVPTSDAASGR